MSTTARIIVEFPAWQQFRHGTTSLLNDLKVAVKSAQEQLGHASLPTTLDIYPHVWDALTVRKTEENVSERARSEERASEPGAAERPRRARNGGAARI